MEPAFSEDFVRQAHQEADRLAAQAAELRHGAARREDEARRMRGEALTLEQRVRELRSVVGSESAARPTEDRELRGQQVRDTAVEVLLRYHSPSTPIHYRQWYELVERQGHRVAGQNPRATFLTQIRRSPVVEGVTGRTGYYVVDPARAATEAVAAVRAAEADLAELVAGRASATKIERARRTVAKAERNLLDVARWQSDDRPSRPLALIAGGFGSSDQEG